MTLLAQFLVEVLEYAMWLIALIGPLILIFKHLFGNG